MWAVATGFNFHKYIGNDSKIKNAKPEYEPTFPRWSELYGVASKEQQARNKTGDELFDEFFAGIVTPNERKEAEQ